MIQVHIKFNEDSEPGRYMLACARIRDITPTCLMHRLVATILEDQLVAGVLDDNDNIRRHNKGEHHYKGPASDRS